MPQGIRDITDMRDETTLLDRSPMMVLVWRAIPGWPVEYASRNFTRLGYEPGHFLSGEHRWLDTVHLDDLRQVEEAVGRCTKSGQETRVTFRMLFPVGIRWIDGYFNPVRDVDGGVSHIQASMLDVTDVHDERERLEQCQRRLTKIFHEPSICFWEVDVFETWHFMRELKAQSRAHLAEMFDRNPSLLAQCIRTLKVIDVNRCTLKLYRAASKEELMANLPRIFGQAGYKLLRGELLCLYEGKSSCRADGVTCTVDGRQFSFRMDWHLLDSPQSPQMSVLVVLSEYAPLPSTDDSRRR